MLLCLHVANTLQRTGSEANPKPSDYRSSQQAAKGALQQHKFWGALALWSAPVKDILSLAVSP